MSEQDVEVIRAGYEAWNAGDMDAFRELQDPEVIVRPLAHAWRAGLGKPLTARHLGGALMTDI
jgi:hypothetical protein